MRASSASKAGPLLTFGVGFSGFSFCAAAGGGGPFGAVGRRLAGGGPAGGVGRRFACGSAAGGGPFGCVGRRFGAGEAHSAWTAASPAAAGPLEGALSAARAAASVQGAHSAMGSRGPEEAVGASCNFASGMGFKRSRDARRGIGGAGSRMLGRGGSTLGRIGRKGTACTESDIAQEPHTATATGATGNTKQVHEASKLEPKRLRTSCNL